MVSEVFREDVILKKELQETKVLLVYLKHGDQLGIAPMYNVRFLEDLEETSL